MSIQSFCIRSLAAVGAFAALATACSNSTEPGSATIMTGAALQAITPIVVSGVAGTAVTPAPSVRAVGANGNPMAGVPVSFAVIQGGGTIDVTSALTDANGVAATAWTLGPNAHALNRLTVSSAGLGSITFSATPTAGAAAIVRAWGFVDGTSAAAGAPLQPLSVLVTDAFGNPVADVKVTFAVAAGGGSITDSIATTNAIGIARSGWWTLGSLGENSVTATVTGVEPAVFTVNVLPAGFHPLGTYELERIQLGSLKPFRLPGAIVLGENGQFTTSLQVSASTTLEGRGTFAKVGSTIAFKYADNFLDSLSKYLDYSPPYGTSPKSELGVVDGEAIVIARCWTEDCYESSWTYRRVSP